MEVLFQTPGSILIAICSIAWLFFFLLWTLELPVVRRSIERRVKTLTRKTDKQVEKLVSGILIRFAGTVHNTVQVVLSLWALTNPALWADTWHGVTRLSQIVALISAGFFLWDIAVAIRGAATDGVEFILHGVLCFSFYFYIACSANFHYYGCSFLLWELSTPFVHLRWLLYKFGLQETRWYLYNGIAMMVVFGLCRIVWGGYLGMKYFVASMIPQDRISITTIWIMRIICITLNGLNWYWFKAMLAAATVLFSKKPTVSSNGEVTTEENRKKEN